jgi:hypothetical protein
MRATSTRAGTNVARLLPFLLFAGFAIFMMIANQRRNGPAQRDRRTWRPRARSRAWQGSPAGAKDSGPDVLRPGDVAGVRDAYSGAAIDSTKPLVRCTNCLALYHSDSVAVLARENSGRCASCGGRDFRAVVMARG